MLIRIAVAASDNSREKELILKLTGISIVMNVEFDIALYSKHFDKLVDKIENIDVLICDLDILKNNRDRIDEFYIKNNKCLPVLLGTAQKRISEYLILRPIAFIESIDSIDPNNKNDKIKKICELFIYIANKEIEEKTDNRVLYITTRQKSYAIPKRSILYCQSDLKYGIFVLDNGMQIRKLGKLQEIEEKYLWDFKRVHQSFLVNPNRIEGIDKTTNELILSNNIRVPFSRKYAADIRGLFNN